MIARLYRGNQQSLVALFESLDDAQWATPVPCTPGWTVREVLSHVEGVADDLANRRLEGAGTPPWTAAQVERSRHLTPAELIARWNAQVDAVADGLEQFGQMRPVFDVASHEHDIRQALGLPLDRQSEMVAVMANGFASGTLPQPVTITFDDGEVAEIAGAEGAGEPLTLSGITQFEFVRSRLGRRTGDQVRGYAWSAAPSEELIDAWFVFGPAGEPIFD